MINFHAKSQIPLAVANWVKGRFVQLSLHVNILTFNLV